MGDSLFALTSFDLPLSFSFFLTLQNTNTRIFVATSTVLKILRIDLSTTVREFVTINISRGRSTMDEFATRPSEKFVRRQRHLSPPELFSQRPSIISERNEESVEFYDTTAGWCESTCTTWKYIESRFERTNLHSMRFAFHRNCFRSASRGPAGFTMSSRSV